MTDYLYTENEVKEMWKRDYSTQIGVIQAKCIEAIVHTQGELAVSFSGGKDSAVLLYLFAEMWSISKWKDQPLKVFFANTTNEFIVMRPYIKQYIQFIEQKMEITIDFQEVRSQYSYFQVVDMVGLPFVSKKVSRMVRDCKKVFKMLGYTYADIEPILPKKYTPKHYDEMLESARKLREMGFWNVIILYLTKITSQDKICEQRFFPVQYRPLIDFDEEFSEECCNYLKKEPIKYASKELGKLLPVTGEMASDSRDRMNSYRQTGCNMFYGKSRKSKPLGSVTEQTILHFIHSEQVPISPVYGECVCEGCEYKLTGEQRTGCKLCGFGLKFDPDRFIRLQQYEPKTVQFAFTSKENGGLGYKRVCEFLNEHCGMKIGIPEFEEGYYEQRAIAYKNRSIEQK